MFFDKAAEPVQEADKGEDHTGGGGEAEEKLDKDEDGDSH